ncbi:MAG TPA: DUF885 family protein, partial [Steroidobacteraceae bacterium]
MRFILRYLLFAIVIALHVGLAPVVYARNADLDAFFDQFAAEWVENDPDLATATRYFSGPRQQRLERMLTPETRQWRNERAKRAERGIRALEKFDPSTMSDTQRISAELMRWQLQAVIDANAFADYEFPLNQFRGANVGLIDGLTVQHPLATAQDADNYLARMSQIDERMKEALAEARRLARKNMIPPRFILEATLRQMRTFM